MNIHFEFKLKYKNFYAQFIAEIIIFLKIV